MPARALVFETMRTRRVVRSWREQPVSRADLLRVVRAARWAPAAGNRRLQRYVIIQDLALIRLVRAVSPGITGIPSAIIVICLDRERVARLGSRFEPLLYLDVGTAGQNMLLAAHALSLGGGPVTSFSAEAVRVLLRLPPSLAPAMLIPLGFPAPEPVRKVLPDAPVRLSELVIWERFPAGPSGHQVGQGGGEK